eukprot:4714578-Ditylum_brightwellii.AAC.1
MCLAADLPFKEAPTVSPSVSLLPLEYPSDMPSMSIVPSDVPSVSPLEYVTPLEVPSDLPSVSMSPSDVHIMSPSLSTLPSHIPSKDPSTMPSIEPTIAEVCFSVWLELVNAVNKAGSNEDGVLALTDDGVAVVVVQ